MFYKDCYSDHCVENRNRNTSQAATMVIQARGDESSDKGIMVTLVRSGEILSTPKVETPGFTNVGNELQWEDSSQLNF